MATRSKLDIFARYRNSQPPDVQMPARSLDRIHTDFLSLIDRHPTRTQLQVDRFNVTADAPCIEVYQTALSCVFHRVGRNDEDQSCNSATPQLFTLREVGETFVLATYSIYAGRSLLELNDAMITLSDSRLELVSDNGNTLKLERSKELLCGAIDVPVWLLNIYKFNELIAQHRLVVLRLGE